MTDLIVLGIDGADPEYLEEALKKYDMPGWSRLMEGFYTELPSTVPAITLPAWPSMFSGYNPGKFEAYHLAMADYESWSNELTDSTYFQGHHFWDWIDGKVGLHFIPGTSPVYPINGWMRSGSLLKNFEFYPEELEEELEDKLDLVKENSHGKTTSRAKIEAEKRNFEKERVVSNYILEKDPEVMTTVFQLVDRTGHFAEKEDQIIKAYADIDGLVQEHIKEAEDRSANLIVVSDHGFQHATTKLNLISFLREKNYLDFKEGSGETLAYRIAKPLLDTPLKKYLKYIHDLYQSQTGENLIGRESGVLGSVAKSSRVVPYFAEGREAGMKVHTTDMPHGIVNPEEKEEVIEDLIEDFQSLEKDGEKVIEKIWRGENLYPRADDRPDLVIQAREGVVVSTDPSSRIFDGTNSFTHNETGVFFARGPDINQEADVGMEIFDVAPLIYTLLGEKIPEDLDGELPVELVPDIEPEYKTMDADDIEF